MAFMLCGLVVLVSGWTSRTHSAPPTCASHMNARWDSGGLILVHTPGRPDRALYTRFCGPATARVHHNGTPFLIRGGRCFSRDPGYMVVAGLMAKSSARAKWLGLYLHDPRADHPGTLRLAETATGTVYARIQLGGPELQVTGGTITIGRSMRDGTFALHLRNATRVTGSWTCG
jgi:hypothetical protein